MAKKKSAPKPTKLETDVKSAFAQKFGVPIDKVEFMERPPHNREMLFLMLQDLVIEYGAEEVQEVLAEVIKNSK